MCPARTGLRWACMNAQPKRPTACTGCRTTCLAGSSRQSKMIIRKAILARGYPRAASHLHRLDVADATAQSANFWAASSKRDHSRKGVVAVASRSQWKAVKSGVYYRRVKCRTAQAQAVHSSEASVVQIVTNVLPRHDLRSCLREEPVAGI